MGYEIGYCKICNKWKMCEKDVCKECKKLSDKSYGENDSENYHPEWIDDIE